MDKEQRIFYTSLFLSGSPLDKKFFRKVFDPINLENRLLSYVEQFNKLELGMRIRMVSGGYQMVTDKELVGALEPYFGEKTDVLSRASLETSAIIAYKQPITRIEIDEIRGVNSSGTVRYLLEKNMIKVTGRKDVPGRPLLYSTTKYFLEYMGINDISELPTFREWQELKTKQ
ncbi:chromosome segregation and condensation protein, ScpB [Denitrovibrio acetiphilus DSM 12809]|uniref:Chromosome segregation and condensation protein, ScpB n=1 Tax=Denitrovibrio acetiphilus (strain DSM 12809 / NBRC 114555 / N2460) TaxID=522772 RepID=D4H7Y8_DENA2|nr:SMC-Scp complex subunit ScpB [Denitrovibrio acetiphilus]ADD68137.1 chromosome segregation and condensation protein, ScpB [Denitrovibrio acetiphilus DSM 12809]